MEYLTVPDDPRFRTTAGQGYDDSRASYNSSLPSTARRDCQTPWGDDWFADWGDGVFGLGNWGSGPSWYRLPAAHGLAAAYPGGRWHCGTHYPGWVSGWPAGGDQDSGTLWRAPGTDGPDDPGQPGYHYATPPAEGALPPPAGQPPAAAMACFDNDFATCYSPTRVMSVGCGAFTLWELPPTPTCNLAYCLAA